MLTNITLRSSSSSDVDAICKKVYKTEDIFYSQPGKYLFVPFVNNDSVECYIHHTNYDDKPEHWSEFQTCRLSKFHIISRVFYCGINSMVDCLRGIDDNLYCVLPAYFHKQYRKLTDFQLVVSGSIEKNESPLETCSRELAEEIGMDGNIIHTGSYNAEYKNSQIKSHVFRVHLTSPTDVKSFVGIKEESHNVNLNKSDKVVFIPLIENPMHLIERKRIFSTDNAGESVIIFKVGMLKLLLVRIFGNRFANKI